MVMRRYNVKLGELLLVKTPRYSKPVKAVVVGGSHFLQVRLYTKSDAVSKVATTIYSDSEILERGII